MFVISQWRDNEVKYAIIKMQNVNAEDDYGRNLNCKLPIRSYNMYF